jgi:4-hydroxy-3-polyprenylbenzoate decarboxylase
MAKDITTLRGMLDFLQKENDVLAVNNEVDPMLEMAGIIKQLDNGPVLQFNNIKGFAGQRIVSSLFSRADRVAKVLDVTDPRKLKFRGLEGIKNPIPPKIVESAPCQEVVITKDIDINGMLPVPKYTATDAGRIIGGGIVLISGTDIGHCITYKRMNFRGKDWATLAFNPGSHFEHFILDRRVKKQNLPLTVNIGTGPGVGIVAGGGGVPLLIPNGTDELAIAGRIQGAPVQIVKAKTVDAWAVADSEWVIEGYVDTNQVVWENEEAEKKPEAFAPYFPESLGHVGRARQTYKFVATAITHRKDNPIYYAPLAHSLEYQVTMSFAVDATIYEILNRQWPGLVKDVNALPAMMGPMGIVIQVAKRRDRDERSIRDIIISAFMAANSMRMVVVVDDDVDIYNTDEVLWAIITRCDFGDALVELPPGGSWSTTKNRPMSPSTPKPRLGFDCTVPVSAKVNFNRGEFTKVDLTKWYTPEQIARVRSIQSEYAKLLAEKRV